jgi:O-antigen/teichoic acid export membrane protein
VAELKKKIFYGVALTISRFFFPIITYPYVSRVLGPDKLGLLNFSEAYANYFVLIAALGIPMYGVREVSKVKDNQTKLNRVSTEITIIHLISSVICMAFFFVSIISADKLRQEWTLNAIFGLNILISFISLEWFFIGIEKFKFITIRSIITRLLPVTLIFVFVKDESDYIAFQILNTGAFLINALLNLWFIRRYVSFTSHELRLRQHFKPLLQIFFSSVFIQFYSMMDSLMLGLLSTYKSVGIYSAASKLSRILTNVIASVGNVLVPRISNLVSIGEKDRSIAILTKSIQLSIGLTFPLGIGFFLLSPELVMIMYGSQFADSVLICKILSPIIVITGISNVYTIQFLLTHSREKELFIVYLSGTILTIVLNTVMVIYFDFIGAGVAMLITEFFICAFAWRLTNKIQTLEIPWKYLISCFLFCVLFWPIVSLTRSLINNVWLIVIVSFTACGGVYFIFQFTFFRPFITDEIFSLLGRKRN